ncbi:DUF5610 domain-containing protein [Marinospirillum insulare]|uniref:DUF5610 domain-containing protein n=1 Tax=Marinospirillum insulare TaxID=217169 RepID=A0ABQ5ZYZ7_9GAMM|nr:DUF5610 domain-containing protein [Marinospirillum insulare]GLR63104.1 hypothetical protein GCM10007878_05390 [Marinospirillum insulare]
MASANITLSNASPSSSQLGKAQASTKKSNAPFAASLQTTATDKNPAGVKTKLTTEEKAEFAKQAEATTLENKRTLLQTMFAQGKEGDSKAMRIFYQEAASAIEGVLQKEFGDEDFSLQKLIDKTSGIEGQEDYWSSENTAERIMIGATSYFETFKKQNPRLSDEEAVEKYMNLITPALEKGMGEAVNILQGFGAFEGHVKDTVQETQRLVFEKLEAFRDRILGKTEQDDKPLFDDANPTEESQ